MTLSTTLTLSALLLLAAFASAQAPSRNARRAEIVGRMKSNEFINDPVRGSEVVDRMLSLQEEIINAGGCNPNLCFAIDGSRQILPIDFTRQVDFISLIAAVVGASLGFEDRIAMAAYQYGGRLNRIIAPTRNVDNFLDAANSATFARSRITFLSPAILACRRDFENNFREDANKMVLIGDGRSNFRGNSLAISEAAKFLPPNNNGAICAITVRFPDFAFWDEVTQDMSRVLPIEDTTEFVNLLESVVRNVCDIV